MAERKRIAICGFNLESNRWSPPCGRADFEENMYVRGAGIMTEARAEHPAIHLGVTGFTTVMDRHFGGPDGWEAVPVLLIGSTPAGPVEETFFKEFLAELDQGLRAAGRLDGVYVCQHGGAIATHTHDPDGDTFATVRAAVGPGVPVVATLDLHANVSEVMMETCDVFIGYRTNPHIDQRERGAEAADVMLEMLAGMKPAAYRVRLPLVAPSVTQLTAAGHPYGDLIRLGQTRVDDKVVNVTVLSGFAFADTPKNGMTVIVTTRGDAAHAKTVALDLAEAGWADRQRYVPRMISLDDAVARAKAAGSDPAAPALVFADPADNPGGGGRGNTTWILDAFLKAGVTGCALAVFWDKALVAKAFAAGEGARISATFNTEETSPHSKPLTADATVLTLADGRFVGHHGMAAGRSMDLGATAVLDLGGIKVVCITKRTQCLSTDYLAAFGIDPAACRSIVVKSRGHFRAGFQHMFEPARIHEVDVPGLTTPNLANLDWKHLPRPVFPIDPAATWDRSRG
jgi:microcystin degradation protein MlrC